MSETEHFRGWDGDCTLHREVDRLDKEEEQEEEADAAGSYGPPGVRSQGSSLCTRVSKESNLDGRLSRRHEPRPRRKVNSQKRGIGKDVPKGIEREDEQSFQTVTPDKIKETPSPNSLSTMLLLLLLLQQQPPIVRENGTPKSVC